MHGGGLEGGSGLAGTVILGQSLLSTGKCRMEDQCNLFLSIGFL